MKKFMYGICLTMVVLLIQGFSVVAAQASTSATCEHQYNAHTDVPGTFSDTYTLI